MSYSKRKVSSQEKSPSVYFASAKSYFSFDSQTAAFGGRAGPMGGRWRARGRADQRILLLLIIIIIFPKSK